MDVVVDTSVITNYVKVKTYTSIGIDATGISGTFQGGETVTGGTSGATGTLSSYDSDTQVLKVRDLNQNFVF